MNIENIEQWKDINGYEGYYQISNLGRVKSLTRNISNGKGEYRIEGMTIVPYKGGNGYIKVDISRDGKKKKIWLHRLIAIHFIANPENKPQINHIDGNTSNNSLENLEWVTQSENCKHSYKYLNNSLRISNKKTGAEKWNARKVIQQDCYGKEIKIWPSLADAARGVGTKLTNIYAAASGKQKTCMGFRWEYFDQINQHKAV